MLCRVAGPSNHIQRVEVRTACNILVTAWKSLLGCSTHIQLPAAEGPIRKDLMTTKRQKRGSEATSQFHSLGG